MNRKVMLIILVSFRICVLSQDNLRTGIGVISTSTNNKEAMNSYNLGYLAFNEEKYVVAIKYYRHAISLDTLFIDAIDNLAVTYRRLNNLDSAEYFNIKSLNILPNNVLALNNLAIVYYKKGQLEKASNTYEQIIAYDSLNADGYYGLADIQLKQDNFESAIFNGLKAYHLWETTNQLYAGDAMYIVGLAKLFKGDKEDALISFKESLKLGTKVPDKYIDACK